MERFGNKNPHLHKAGGSLAENFDKLKLKFDKSLTDTIEFTLRNMNDYFFIAIFSVKSRKC